MYSIRLLFTIYISTSIVRITLSSFLFLSHFSTPLIIRILHSTQHSTAPAPIAAGRLGAFFFWLRPSQPNCRLSDVRRATSSSYAAVRFRYTLLLRFYGLLARPRDNNLPVESCTTLKTHLHACKSTAMFLYQQIYAFIMHAMFITHNIDRW